jgi:hypothetical protein
MMQMTMRRRIRSLGQSASATAAAGRSVSRAVAAVSRPARERPEPTDRPSGDTFEWATRKSDGPTDCAFYDCGCGYQFTARVATTVSCPNCGSDQAW